MTRLPTDEDIQELLALVPKDIMDRYRRETGVRGELDYKLKFLLIAATHDAPPNKIVQRAAHVINHSLLIRDVLKIDHILDDSYFPTHLVKRLEDWSCLSVVGNDLKGSPVIYFNLKMLNPQEYAELWKAGAGEVPEGFKGHAELDDPCVVNYCSLWYVRMMEWIHQHRFELFRERAVQVPKVVMVLNIEAAGLSTYSSELRQFLKGIKVLGMYLFPEICDYIYAANVPWVADKVWSLIKIILHPETVEKVNLYDKSRTKKTLPNLIPSTSLPVCFGGNYEPERSFKRKHDQTLTPGLNPDEPPSNRIHSISPALSPSASN
jgi:hypothetical protein